MSKLPAMSFQKSNAKIWWIFENICSKPPQSVQFRSFGQNFIKIIGTSSNRRISPRGQLCDYQRHVSYAMDHAPQRNVLIQFSSFHTRNYMILLWNCVQIQCFSMKNKTKNKRYMLVASYGASEEWVRKKSCGDNYGADRCDSGLKQRYNLAVTLPVFAHNSDIVLQFSQQSLQKF